MTHQPDDRQPEEPRPGSSDVEPSFDEDAAWAQIVANYGERPEMGPAIIESVEPIEPAEDHEPERSRPPRNLFDRTYLDSSTDLNTDATWDDEGHFVPPNPPPLPSPEPRRALAWVGLFGAPLLMLIAVVFGWSYPTWFSALLVAGFVGGFVFLVATMARKGPDDWSGDDGAVI